MNKKHSLIVALALVAGLFFTHPAQAASVTGTLSTTVGAGAVTSALFVRAGEKARYQLTGTWVGTIAFEMSSDAGASYQLVGTAYTSNVSTETDPRTNDVRYRFRMTAYTSGTASYDITNVAYSSGRNKFSSVEIGSVAYASFGSIVTPVSGTLYVGDVIVTRDMTVQGIGVLNGATVGTDKYVFWLFDSSGLAKASTALAGTTASGANAFQEIALTGETKITAGKYWIGIRQNGTTNEFRSVAANTFIGVLSTTFPHSDAAVGSFGSTIYAIAVPTAFAAGQAPISYVYGY